MRVAGVDVPQRGLRVMLGVCTSMSMSTTMSTTAGVITGEGPRSGGG